MYLVNKRVQIFPTKFFLCNLCCDFSMKSTWVLAGTYFKAICGYIRLSWSSSLPFKLHFTFFLFWWLVKNEHFKLIVITHGRVDSNIKLLNENNLGLAQAL